MNKLIALAMFGAVFASFSFGAGGYHHHYRHYRHHYRHYRHHSRALIHIRL